MTFDELAKLIEFEYEETRRQPDGTQWYRIKLWYKGRMFATEYFQGADLEAAGWRPTLDRVLHALQLECEWGRMTFVEYCKEAELSTEDVIAKTTWIRAMTIYNQLCDLFMGEFLLFDRAEEEIA